MAIVYLLIGLIAFAAIGVPLAFSIGASCIAYLSAAKPMFLSMMPQRIWNGVYSELMIAMPPISFLISLTAFLFSWAMSFSAFAFIAAAC